MALLQRVMKPINEDILVACESAKQMEGPQNMHESNTVSNHADMIGPCRGVRRRKVFCSFSACVPPGKAAVMQICCDTNHCHVLHLIHSGIPQNLQLLLEDPTVLKVGAGIAGDATKVSRDYGISIKGVEDLSFHANQKLGGGLHNILLTPDGTRNCFTSFPNWLVNEKTVATLMSQTCSPILMFLFLVGTGWVFTMQIKFFNGGKLMKPSKIRMGNWETPFLSKEQLDYAATDAFASWFLYQTIKDLPDVQDVTDKGSEVDVVPQQ
ncbi:werner syndrome-like exonuclease-like protein [Trifolium pratense]|uniref:Werner syndrome-like exonuclease-like protein n=1 Tax=Trifolium pratense TaxID=57577 RepID=A0A2K3PLP5_TRIPR|nr:werner syndrome-like exonuclease-like protein [Trifolium pratense]